MGVDQCLDGGGQDNFYMGGTGLHGGGLGSHGGESPPSPPHWETLPSPGGGFTHAGSLVLRDLRLLLLAATCWQQLSDQYSPAAPHSLHS